MFAEKLLSAIGLELKKHREQLNQFIQKISIQTGVTPKCILEIESWNMSFFVVTNYV
jgi:hypothetical protein